MGFSVLESRKDQSQIFFNFEMILAEMKYRMSAAEGFPRMAQDSQEIESAVRVCAGRDSTGLSGMHLRYRQGFLKKRFLPVVNG